MLRKNTKLLPRVFCVVALILAGQFAFADTGPAREPSVASAADEVQLDKGLMAEVENRTGLRAAENEIYYAVLAHARDSNFAAQQRVAELNQRWRKKKFEADPKNNGRTFSPFVDVFLHPNDYQGELVSMDGYVRKIDEFSVEGENDLGLKTLYQVWIYTDDSQSHPAVVICTQVPEGIREKLREDGVVNNTRFVGYFYKLYAYRAQDDYRVAPMFMAQKLEWERPPKQDTGRFSPLLAGVVMGSVLIVILAVWWVGRRDRQLQTERRKREEALNQDAIARVESLINEEE